MELRWSKRKCRKEEGRSGEGKKKKKQAARGVG